MLRGIFVIVFGLAALDNALAQKSYHAPPRSVLPGNPTAPPPSYSLPPSVSSPSPSYNASPNSGYSSEPPQMQQIPLPPCYPHDCETLEQIEEARKEFVKCLDESKRSDGKIDSDEMQDCVFKWMAPHKFETFAECWQDVNNSAWTCFDRAYIAKNEKSSGPYGSASPPQNQSAPYRPQIPQQAPPQASLPLSTAQPASEGVHPFWNCNSSSRTGPNNYDDQILFSCLAGELSRPQMDRFMSCVNSTTRGYDYCYDQAIR